jgi:DNA processing protein
MTDTGKIGYIPAECENFPERLMFENEPLKGIYCKGNAELLKKRSIAIVGSRKCSEYGKRVAMKIAQEAVSNGFCVVSGMAIGIDNFAHQGALQAGGNTIAVLGTGADICYPPQHRKLYGEICSKGLIVTEYPPGTEAMPYRFPQRNRIIAGLSEAVVVVEARSGSGSLITAELADSQNKPVFAVPGNITSTRSVGCNNLIYEGANMVRSGEDILELLSISTKSRQEKKEIILDKDEKKLYSLLEEGYKTFDELIENSGIMPMEMSEILLKMELDGIIIRTSSNSFEIKS